MTDLKLCEKALNMMLIDYYTLKTERGYTLIVEGHARDVFFDSNGTIIDEDEEEIKNVISFKKYLTNSNRQCIIKT